MRCRHKWIETRRAYSQARDSEVTDFGTGQEAFDAFDRFVFGVTSIELQCEHCGDLRHHQSVGDLTQ